MGIIDIGLRAWQFLFTLLVTALVGNVIASANGGNPALVNYSIFVAVWCWIVVIYGALAAFMTSLAIPVAMMALDGLALIFTLCAGIALAAELGVHSCGNYDYTTTNNLTSGTNDTSKRCHELQASCAFFWFLFASFVVTTALSVRGSGGGISVRGGGMRKGGPSMSQV